MDFTLDNDLTSVDGTDTRSCGGWKTWFCIGFILLALVIMFVVTVAVTNEMKQELQRRTLVRECKLTPAGSDYGGVVSTANTHENFKCLPWTNTIQNWLHEENNYCRGIGNGDLQCNTLKGLMYCYVPMCNNNLVKNECLTGNGTDYRGLVERTKSSRKCQRWERQYPHKHPYINMSDHENYCRSPDSSARPWCYTTDENKRWEYCDIPSCYKFGENCIHQVDQFTYKDKGKYYNGKISHTASGHKCNYWQSAFRNYLPTFTLENEDHNYCRNPEGIFEKPWCYAAPSEEIRFCNVPICDDN